MCLKICSVKCMGKKVSDILNVEETDSFASSVTKEEYKINYCFNCNEKWLTYLLTCKVCLKQCVGQTVYEFISRWNKSVLKTVAPLDLNIEGIVWETFLGIMDCIFSDKICGSRLVYYFLLSIVYYCNCWSSLLKVLLGSE